MILTQMDYFNIPSADFKDLYQPTFILRSKSLACKLNFQNVLSLEKAAPNKSPNYSIRNTERNIFTTWSFMCFMAT